MFTKIKERVSTLTIPPILKNKYLLTGIVGSVLATAIVISVWQSSGGFVALYGEHEKLPVAQVIDVLGGEYIPYRIHPDNGQILVKEAMLAKARMALAAKGISAAIPDGYELMDKEEMLGSSQFVQNVRYKRSLEGELSRSIMALDPVESARVHLGLSEESSFVMNNKPENSASVLVQLHYGKTLNDQQVAAIIQLVSGSIPGMNNNSVRVVDQNGNLLSENVQATGNLSSLRHGQDVAKRIKDETIRNLSDILTPLVGANNFRISVSPQIDTSSVEETQERLGKEPLVTDESINNENITNELAIGIPGSLSNRPPLAPSATMNPQAASSGQAASRDPAELSTRRQEQRKYAFDRDIRHIRHAGFKLEKMRVAIALNKASPALGNITPVQIASITRLLEDAASIEKERGDSLTMDILTFTVTKTDFLPGIKWWQDPSIQFWGQNGGLGILALLTLFFGMRPLMKRLGKPKIIEKEDEHLTPLISQGESLDSISLDEKIATSLPISAFQNDDNLPPQSSGLETKIEFLQMLAQSETERVAEVLKQWINSNERNNNRQE